MVGTGGASLRLLPQHRAEQRLPPVHRLGALRLYLGARGYSWTFLNTGGGAMDSGSFARATP